MVFQPEDLACDDFVPSLTNAGGGPQEILVFYLMQNRNQYLIRQIVHDGVRNLEIYMKLKE